MTAAISIVEVRNALRCPRAFALGRAGGQAILFPIGASAMGAVFHRLVAAFARDPDMARLSRLPPRTSEAEIAGELAGSLLRLLAADLARSPSHASMAAEVDDLAEALREFARHVAGACTTPELVPAEAAARFLAGAQMPLELELDHGVRLSGRLDVLHVAGGAVQVVEYKLADDAREELDRAQVALYRFVLARARKLDAAPVILRFDPGLSATGTTARDADALVAERLVPLFADMIRWDAEPRSAPPTERRDLCPACPVRGACAEMYPEPLAARDQPPAGARRPRPDPLGEVHDEVNAEPLSIAAPIDDRQAIREAERFRGLILDILKKQGVPRPTAPPALVGARLIQIQVSVSRGSMSAIQRAAADVEHRLEADHGLTARFGRKGALRVFTIPRPRPRPVQLSDLLAAEAGWLSERPGRFVVGETTGGATLTGDLADPSSCQVLIGGVANSGRSALLRAIAASLVQFHGPAAIQLTLIDAQRAFARLAAGLAAHLHRPPVRDPEEAIQILEELIEEMEQRYALLDSARVQDLDEYNETQPAEERLVRRVVLIDEIQDLVAARSSRDAFIDIIQRLGSKARAAGIHLILSTQRPTREVVPPSLTVNLAGKIALRVTSAAESSVIVGSKGAEDLLGSGDLLADLGHGLVRAQAPSEISGRPGPGA